jgi:pimeloyl-ACP methyl ester carboxylesterase
MLTRTRKYGLSVVLVAAALLVGASLWLGARLTAPAPASAGTSPADLNVSAIELEDAEGSITRGWNAPVQGSRGVVVLAHGIRGSRRSMIPRARLLASNGFSSVLIDLHAHGESDGSRITLGDRERESVRSAVHFARAAYPNQPIAVLGVSLGGAAAALALPLPIDALVLEPVFPDVESAIHHRVHARLGWLGILPTWLLLAQVRPRLGVSASELSPASSLHDAACPVLIMGGELDPHTPPQETRRLHAAAPEGAKLWLVPDAPHVDLYGAAEAQYEARLLPFLRDSLSLSPR